MNATRSTSVLRNHTTRRSPPSQQRGTWLALTRNATADLLEDDAMTATRARIQQLVVRIQSDVLDNPTLALTLPAAGERFGLDELAGRL